jgi:uncharacterized protein YebE (UPF0316 family)
MLHSSVGRVCGIVRGRDHDHVHLHLGRERPTRRAETARRPAMRPFMIMGLVLVEVALWQWRVAVTGRGQFIRGAVLGGVGAVIQITVVIRLVGEVGSTASIAGYAAGVAFGVAVGGLVDRRATRQMVKVQVIAPSRLGLPEGLRVRGWPTTRFTAHGHDEELDVVNIAIEERLLPELEEAVDGFAPDAGWIIERIVRGRGLESPLAA